MKYLFYFDETYNDKRITLNERGYINVLQNDKSDTYIGVFTGFTNDAINNAVAEFEHFEHIYKKLFDIKYDKEIKSEVVKVKQYKYGLRSFNNLSYNFYYDFFNILKNNNIILHITYMSKLECYIKEVFKDIKMPMFVNRTKFLYSLIKFFIHFNDEELFKALYRAQDEVELNNLKELLCENFERVIFSENNIERKVLEHRALLEMLTIIDNAILVPVKTKVDFDYDQNFVGLLKLLDELSIKPNKVKLVIDYEENTFNAASKYSFGKLCKSHSKDNIRLRFSDLLAGFIGRMIVSIVNDLQKNEVLLCDLKNSDNYDIASRRMLDLQWFNLDEKTLELYKLVYFVLVKKQNHYWNTNSSIYFDGACCFYSLLEYISQYRNIEEYNSIELKEHQMQFNNLCCTRMYYRYKKMKF